MRRLGKLLLVPVHRWKKLGLSSRWFLTSVALGCAFEYVGLPRWRHYPLVQTIEQSAVDWVVGVYRGTAPTRSTATPYVYIDIDEKTYRAWGEPLIVPRDKLASLIRFALEGSPRLLIVDVDLAWGVGSGDEAVVSALSNQREPERPAPPIILALSLRPRGPGEPRDRARTVRRSIVDDLAARGGSIHWAAVEFDRDADWKVRTFRKSELVCVQGRLARVSSAPFAAASLLRGERPDYQYDPTKVDAARATCEDSPGSAVHDSAGEVHDGERARSVSGTYRRDPFSGLERRIIFTIPWTLDSGESRPLVTNMGRRVPLLSTISARDLTDGGDQVSRALVNDAVVVIGGSFAEGRDVHSTPGGPLPGALVIVNAIHSLLEFGELHHSARWLHELVSLATICLVAGAFTLVPSFFCLFVCSIGVAIVALVSIVLLKDGVWLDFSMPLVAVLVHGVIEDAKEDIVGVWHRLRRSSGAH